MANVYEELNTDAIELWYRETRELDKGKLDCTLECSISPNAEMPIFVCTLFFAFFVFCSSRHCTALHYFDCTLAPSNRYIHNTYSVHTSSPATSLDSGAGRVAMPFCAPLSFSLSRLSRFSFFHHLKWNCTFLHVAAFVCHLPDTHYWLAVVNKKCL